MAGVFKRSLFKAPVYEHYGTGIASGLDDRPGYAAGGRIGYAAGSPDPESESDARNSLNDFIDQAVQTIPQGLENAIVTEYLSNLDHISGLDKDAQKAYFNDFVNGWYDTLPEDILNFIKQGSKEGATKQSKALYDSIKETFQNTFENIDSYVDPMYLKSIEDNGQAMPNYASELDMFNNTFGGQLGGLSEIAQIDLNPPPKEDVVLDPGDTTGGDDTDGGGLGTLAGLPGIQTDEGRTAAIDYLKQAQMETELQDKARHQAIEAGFMNLGAADPVQPWEGMGRATFRAFQEPMAALREREYQLGQDMYTNIRDRVTDDARRPDQVKFMEHLAGNPLAMKTAKEIYGSSASGGLDLQQAYAIAEDIGDQELATMFGVDVSEIEKNRSQYVLERANQIQQMSITNPGALMQESIAKVKDGGRVGYQQGALVTDPNAQPVSQEMAAAQQGVPPQQGIEATAPTNLTFEELRAALPDYITDNVVQLLVEDKAALSEFVEIKTRTEADDFEDKYRVELNLPEQDEEMIPTTEFA